MPSDAPKSDKPAKEKAPKAEKAAKPAGSAKPEKGSKADKAGKGKAAEAGAEAPAAKAKPAPPPRPPADPRLKYLKKFHGKFLPRGPLRDRHKALMTRWSSGEDHGGVTADELKSLYEDWKQARAKRRKAPTG